MCSPASSARMQPFWAPFSPAARASGGACRCRRWRRYPRRAGTGAACGPCGNFESRTGASLMIRPAAWIFDASTSSSLTPFVADVRIRQGDDLAAIAGGGEDFLVAGERGVEHHFTDGSAARGERRTLEDRAVCQGEDRGRSGKQIGQHGKLRCCARAQLCFRVSGAHPRARLGRLGVRCARDSCEGVDLFEIRCDRGGSVRGAVGCGKPAKYNPPGYLPRRFAQTGHHVDT
ncbi:hypothetical protein Ddc_23473 [Ditylenchus destructor]|nr:hypothetical protein Ddc_23473 [Ditylenchus destructor]